MKYEDEQEVKNQALDQISEQINAGFTSGVATGQDLHGEEQRVSWELSITITS